jgi:hypothetical protein
MRSDEIFLIHGILLRFDIMDCMSMTTPMTTNLKKLSNSTSYSDLVDLMIYMKLIGSLMYLVNVRPDIFFIVNTLNHYLVEAKAVPMGSSEAWYSWILSVSCESEVVEIYRFTLSKECNI